MTDIELNHWFPTTIGASYYPNHLKEKDELIKYCYEIKSKTKRGGEGWVSSETYNTSDGQLDINHDEKFMGISNFVVESVKSYLDQGVKETNTNVIKDLIIFFRDRMKNILKEKKFRTDVIEASVSSHLNDNFLELYKKTAIMNKFISKDLGKNAL